MTITKPILILQLRPEDSTSNAEFEAFLKYAVLEEKDVRRIRIEKAGLPVLDLDDFSAIIVGGSPFDISTPEDEKLPIQKKIEADFKVLLKQVLERDFPFLGACSGNGLLGWYLDTPITRKYAEPVSSADIMLTSEGEKDPLLKGFPKKIKVLLGHKEACDHTPKGATLLMKGAACPVQMFRVGNNVYATQFHPEGDCEGFTIRIHAYKHHGYFEPEKAQQYINKLQNVETPFAQKILKRFVQKYAQ